MISRNSFLLVITTLLAVAALAPQSRAERINATLEIDRTTGRITGVVVPATQPTTQPVDPGPVVPPAPPVLDVTSLHEGGKLKLAVRVLGEARDHPVTIYVRTKAATETAGTIAPGDSLLTWEGTVRVPVKDRWEYWAWGVATNAGAEAKGAEAHVRVQVQLPPPDPQPIPTGFQYRAAEFTIPDPPADALVTRDLGAFEAAVRAGRPAVLEHATVNRRLDLRDPRKLWIRNCTLDMPTGGWNAGHLLDFSGRGSGVYIQDNTFQGMRGDCAIAGGDHRGNHVIDDLVIAHNDFLDLPEGVHIFGPFPAGPGKGTIVNNYFRGIRRYGLELQHGGESWRVEGNYYHKPAVNPATGFVFGPDVEFCSAAANETGRVRIAGNISIFDSSSQWTNRDRNGYHIEAGGREVEVVGNLMIGPGVAGVAALSTHGDATKTQATIRGNWIHGVPEKAMQWGGPVIADGGTVFVNDWRRDNVIDMTLPPIPARPAGVGRRK